MIKYAQFSDFRVLASGVYVQLEIGSYFYQKLGVYFNCGKRRHWFKYTAFADITHMTSTFYKIFYRPSSGLGKYKRHVVLQINNTDLPMSGCSMLSCVKNGEGVWTLCSMT